MRYFLIALALMGPRIAIADTETAIVAGGCFWCVESDFERVPGVIDVVSGYTGGAVDNPTYEQVGNGDTGHYESVMITYNSSQISYQNVLDLFLRSVDPTDADGQFCDRGPTYRSAIFATSTQQKTAKAAIERAEADLGQSVATKVLPAATFWPAEAYHQDYYKGTDIVLTRAGPKKQSSAYKFYRKSCGRDQRVSEIWGDKAAFVK